MKVMMVHAGDTPFGGGGPIAMHRLHCGLRQAGVDSTILCWQKRLASSESVQIPTSPSLARLESWLRVFTIRAGLNDVHVLSSFRIRNLAAYQEADVLDFHCLHSEFFNYLALPFLTAAKPAVYTLHDMWPFTGHCANSYSCERWRVGCGRCPSLHTSPAVWRDGTRLEWHLKNWAYSRSNLAIAAPSRWMADQAAASSLGRFAVHYIPNGVDTALYHPLPRAACREVLGIPAHKKVLMASAVTLYESDNQEDGKGGRLLVAALKNLPAAVKRDVVLLLVGYRGDALAAATGLDAVQLGYVSSDRIKAAAYSAADVFLLPSRVENCPLVVLESLACGTPIVAFNVGGVGELVRPGLTGSLAEANNSDAFRESLLRLLDDDSARDRLKRTCREVAVQEYGLHLQVERYIALYRSLVDRATAA